MSFLYYLFNLSALLNEYIEYVMDSVVTQGFLFNKVEIGDIEISVFVHIRNF